MFAWLSRYGGHVLILAGCLLLSSLLRSAAGPADAFGGQRIVAGEPATTRRAGAPWPAGVARLIASSRRAGEAPAVGVVSLPGASPALPAPAASSSSDSLPPAEAAVRPAAEAATPEDSAAPAPAAAIAEAPPLPPTSRLVIPRIGVDTKVVDVGVLPSGEMEAAAYAVGRLQYTAQAGEAGNVVLAGHNDIYGEVFRRLPELQPGDEIAMYRGDTPFRYRVDVRTIVREEGATEAQRRENARWMDDTDDAATTLISCYPYRVDTHRIILRARLIE